MQFHQIWDIYEYGVWIGPPSQTICSLDILFSSRVSFNKSEIYV